MIQVNAAVLNGAVAAYVAAHRQGQVQREAVEQVESGLFTTVRQLRQLRATLVLHRYLDRVGVGCGGCAICVAIESKGRRKGKNNDNRNFEV